MEQVESREEKEDISLSTSQLANLIWIPVKWLKKKKVDSNLEYRKIKNLPSALVVSIIYEKLRVN